MASHNNHHSAPKAKRRDLIVEKAGNELVVYDLERVRAHCLNEAASQIWQLCNGKRTAEQIAARMTIDLDSTSRLIVVRDTIAQLERLGLVEDADSNVIRMSRRDLARKIGIGIAAGLALPLITSIVAPSPANAASCAKTGQSCATLPCCLTGALKFCCSSGSHAGTCQHLGGCT
jgi:Coenzyme PQQ synthesis protein D (PqqD)